MSDIENFIHRKHVKRNSLNLQKQMLCCDNKKTMSKDWNEWYIQMKGGTKETKKEHLRL